ncbi:MAG: hypothetical protein ACP5G7_05775, partial [Anaerolineae bacterium]
MVATVLAMSVRIVVEYKRLVVFR